MSGNDRENLKLLREMADRHTGAFRTWRRVMVVLLVLVAAVVAIVAYLLVRLFGTN